MTPFEARFADALNALALRPGVGLIAVSGGPDSLALLHLMVRCRERHPLRLVVAHLDHGIHPDSAAVAQAVGNAAADLGLEFLSGELRLGPGTSEGTAREARYAWLFSALDRVGPGVLLTGHHRDDQVETVLMRVLAGSGPAGLAGMTSRGPRLVRPLLGFSRQELGRYLAERGIEAWHDPANVSPVHLRSWLRLEVVPLLQRRLPDLDTRIVALARQAALDRRAWDSLLAVLPLDIQPEPEGISVASGSLRSYDSALGQALIAAAGRRAGLSLGDRRCQRILSLVRSGRSGTRLDLGGNWVAELDFGRLGIRQRRTAGPWQVSLSRPGEEIVTGAWRWRASLSSAPARIPRLGWTTWLAPGEYQGRPWQAGDRIRPLGGSGSRLVVRCMQDSRVARRDRPDWPVVVFLGNVIWVPGVCRSGERLPAPGTEALRIDVERS